MRLDDLVAELHRLNQEYRDALNVKDFLRAAKAQQQLKRVRGDMDEELAILRQLNDEVIDFKGDEK